ncbi:uncharacterized protein M6B38_345200 [Iris pallida]|uniref:Uncharacterized protein n=1 Tax=Iris pallida TaxID=29817 RepID=A0AAX6GTG8_IRIPA|nr:uncharacterized protein M6B38_345200 [Iris pallida]
MGVSAVAVEVGTVIGLGGCDDERGHRHGDTIFFCGVGVAMDVVRMMTATAGFGRRGW